MSCGSQSPHWPQAGAIKDASSAILAASLSAAGIFGAILIFGISMLGAAPQLDWLLEDIRFFFDHFDCGDCFVVCLVAAVDGMPVGLS